MTNMSLLQMSVTGAIMILVIVVVRALTIHKLSKKTFVLLWEVVLLRLLIPLTISSKFSIYSLVKNVFVRGGQHQSLPMEGIASESPMGNGITGEVTDLLELSAGIPEGVHHSELNFSAWAIIWGIGFLMCAAFFLVSYLRCYYEFRTSLPVENEFVARWLGEHKLKRPIQIRQWDRISAPLTYGVFRPVILMPGKSDWENRQQLHYILLHEYTHICRFDIVVKIIATLALCVHWFNPFVWAMYFLFNRDIELSCDEDVLRQVGEENRTIYAKLLISMEEKKSGFLPLYNSFSRNATEERITAIMKTKKVTGWTVMMSAAILVVVVALFATSAEREEVVAGEVSGQDGNGETEYVPINDGLVSNTYAAYFRGMTEDSITVDIVEYVTDEDTERKEELIEELNLVEGAHLSEGNFLEGYYLHNPDTETTEWEIRDYTTYTFIDWEEKYTGLNHPEEYVTSDRSIFEEYVGSYNNGLPGMPFFFEVENGVVISVYEKPFP